MFNITRKRLFVKLKEEEEGEKKEKSYSVIVDSPHESHKRFNFPKFSKSVRIRFGTVDPKRKEVDIEINSIKAILNCRDKVKMKTIFRKKGIPSPLFHTQPIFSFPLVIKKRGHSRGKGMYLIKDKEDLNILRKENPFFTNSYFEVFKECDVEFRIHVIGNKIFHIDKKTLRKDKSEYWVKNLENYKYLECKYDLPIKLLKKSIKAVKVLGLDFCAVDVAMNILTKEFWIYEVNAVPGMRTVIKNKYNIVLTNYIKNILN